MQSLPQEPSAVDLGVVKIKHWVTWRDKDVVTRVTSTAIMAGSVDAEYPGTRNALHLHLEVVDVAGGYDVVEDGGVVGVLLDHGTLQIAREAAWVVGQTGAGAIAPNGSTGQVQSDGTEVDLHVLERSGRHAPTAGTSGQVKRRQAGAGSQGIVGSWALVDAIAGHGSVATVKDGGLLQAGNGRQSPVPILEAVRK